MSDLLCDLNSDQMAAVTAPDGPVLVVAGAGSGKTRVLTTRIAWLLAEGRRHPGAILAFTFTNKAAREMRQRVDRQVGEGRAPFWIGTFHATGVKILRSDGDQLGIDPRFTIFDTDDSLRLIKSVQADLQVDPKQFTPASVRGTISRWKNDDTDVETAAKTAGTYVEETMAKLYAAYERGLARCKALDFDDLVLRTVQLLERVETVREKYARRFEHVLVDEFQDTNPLQLLLVKLLSSHHGNLFAVGDDDQAIYSWRGACVENMLNFEEYFPGTHLYRLEQNYRSSGNILAAANAVVAHNERRKGKELWTASESGDLLSVEEHVDAEDEAARVVGIVQAETAAGATRDDLTILYRTNAQSRLLEDALRRASVPYQLVGSTHFYDRREVRDLMAYLKCVANPADEISIKRIINVPRRGIGDTSVARLAALAEREELTLGETAARAGLLEETLAPAACRRVRNFFAMTTRWRAQAAEQPVAGLLERIIADIDYGEFLNNSEPATATGRNENVAELVNAATAFVEASDGGGLDQFLEQIALVADPDTISDDEGVVRLMTIHTAKGLEFPVVVICGCEDELLPHVNAAHEQSGLEEERRLFYVALTRAQRRVYLLHAGRRRRFGAYEDALPSRFLHELPAELVEAVTLAAPLRPPVAATLFGNGGSRSGRDAVGAAPVPPEAWGRRSRSGGRNSPPRRVPQDGWQDEVAQESPFYEGQLVTHSTFGAGVVVRLEGQGDDLTVTVDFHSGGRKHIIPRFAPLVPLD